jgi:hypothetical protein
MGVGSPAIVEKDFWVCWTLRQIFTADWLPGPLFKGGTSLSKVYGIIARFSEDVDIVLDRHALGFEGDKDPINISGTNQRKRHLEELATACSQTVQGLVREALQKRFHSELGDAGWSITPDVADPDGQSLLSRRRADCPRHFRQSFRQADCSHETRLTRNPLRPMCERTGI